MATNITHENDDEDDELNTSLQIDLDTPKAKKKCRNMEIKPEDIKILAEIEIELERNLSEKAAKSNLSKINVKSILKRVFSNEHVLALVRNAEDPQSEIKLPYEPKFTRAKAKELYPNHNIVEWIPKPKNVSKTNVLIRGDLPEDTSDDEYTPETDKERYSRVKKKPEVPTSSTVDCSTQTSWPSDGISNSEQIKADNLERANIALRTRSKLCLSDTPLEVIEEAFIPPDITTDMYDLECDDDDWKHFLTQFTRPLDEVAKNLEDEELDPEYNFLADEEVYKRESSKKKEVKEELRVDKGVTVTRKELNQLFAELFECEDNETTPQQYQNNETVPENYCEDQKIEIRVLQTLPLLDVSQKMLFEQQMRQHVQVLTENFLMTFDHPEYSSMSNVFKSNLVELKDLVNNQSLKQYDVCNVNPAVDLIENWEDKFRTDSVEFIEHKRHVVKVASESQDAKLSGVNYIPKFSNYFLETISRSEVFLYPTLLPRIPFRPSSTASRKVTPFSHTENQLIALALEQFYPHLVQECKQFNKKRKCSLKDVCYAINKYCVPVQFSKLYKHIFTSRKSEMMNPIKSYFLTNKAPLIVHYVVPLETLKVLPPCKRDPNELPTAWKEYLFPTVKIIQQAQIIKPIPIKLKSSTITKITKPPVFNKTFGKKSKLRIGKVVPKKIFNEIDLTDEPKNTPMVSSPSNNNLLLTPNSSRVQLFSSTPNDFDKGIPDSEIFENTPVNMLPSMPSLGTPARCSPEPEIREDYLIPPVETVNESLNNENCKEEELQRKKEEGPTNIIKDAADDAKGLVAARSTCKSAKRSTCSKQMFSEKKKARLRRDFQAKLRMLSAEDKDALNDKTNRFVQAFYDKLQEQLDDHEYHKFMEILNDFDEHQDSAINLYDSIAEIVGENHPDILDEFLLFFTSHQAKQMKKLIPHQLLNNMSLFLQKLELFFKDQPKQARKVFRALSDLSTNSNVTINQVKTTILPLLKGNSSLTDWFLQVFMSEKPTESLLESSWENVEVVKEPLTSHDECYETITVPEMEDPFGGPNCTCSCHNVEETSYNSRVLHCVPCGTKYMLGKVFVTSRKGLRLARVSFDDDGVDHSSRLSIQSRTKRTDINHKQISPSKDSQDGASSDEEPNKKRKVVKSIKKRTPRKKVEQKTAGDIVMKKADEQKTEIASNSKCEVTELECGGSAESIDDKFSPERPSCESESECCEETSQDNNTDSYESEEEESHPKSDESWTREEDKIILMTYQKEEDEDIAFKKISSVLENRSITQIMERFQVLFTFHKLFEEN